MKMGIVFFLVALIFLAVGDFVSIKSKAFFPSVFISSVLFLFGFWFGLPIDFIEKIGINLDLVNVFISVMIVHMGSMIPLQELILHWKTVVTSVLGVFGVIVFLLVFGILILDKQTVMLAIPPMTGGVVAALMMQDVAKQLNLHTYTFMAITIYIMHGMVGYPLTAFFLKREAKRLLLIYAHDVHAHQNSVASSDSNNSDNHGQARGKWWTIPPLPEKYQTPYVVMAKLTLVAWFAISLNHLIHDCISKYILLLMFGIVFTEIGLLERRPLIKANVFGFCMIVVMLYIFSGISKVTPSTLGVLIYPLVICITLAATGVVVVSFLTYKWFGFSREMATAIALTCFYGFPADYVLTVEVIKLYAKNSEQEDFLQKKMLPPMLVGGFTSVTIASVVIAGFFTKFLLENH
ncbi:MAG: hypothetical protein HQK53_17760 [Oligoflexia bacterium]|nr:hypothetical protein [Oligoflexia bacterium]